MIELADASTLTSAENWLATSGRLLLRVAAMLFMAYLLLLIGTLALSALGASVSTLRSTTASAHRHSAPRRRALRGALGTPAPAGPRVGSQAKAPVTVRGD